jgi:Mce-associated membrane protein
VSADTGEAPAAGTRAEPPSGPAAVRSRVRRTLRARRALAGWAAAWTAAAVVCGLGAWSYAGTRGDGALSYGKARDAALADGRRDIARLNTVDARHAAGDLDAWLEVTTGPLHDRMSSTHTADTATVRQAGTSATGTVTDAAVTELDARAGTAKLIATVEVRRTPSSGTAATTTTTTDRQRFEADLSRTPAGWKLTALTAVPVGAS